MRMMAVVEGIPLETLRAGPTWDWRSFGDYLDRFEGAIGVNAGFLVGHSVLRRVAMGDAATDAEASDDQLAAMVALLHEAFDAGALGFSSSRDRGAHRRRRPLRAVERGDGGGADRARCRRREHEGTTLEFIPAIGKIPRDRMELMAEMSLAADRPLNWNLLGSMSPVEIYEQQLEACDLAADRGAHVVALTIPDLLRLRANNMFDSQREFAEINALPDAERRAALRDPEVRARLSRRARPRRGAGDRDDHPVRPHRGRGEAHARDGGVRRLDDRADRRGARRRADRRAARRRAARAAPADDGPAVARAVTRTDRRGLERRAPRSGRTIGSSSAARTPARTSISCATRTTHGRPR